MFEFIKKLFLPITLTLDFIQKYFKTIVFITILIFISDSNNEKSQTSANLQKIDLLGPIMDPRLVLEKINKAKDNDNIKGVLFLVNSPGGAVAPSVELAYAIKELQEIKPVIAYASGTIASGSYYASIWANKIIANPGSMVGSIGVIFQGANLEELMTKIGIKTQTVKAGRYKESGTQTRAWNDFEKAELQSVIKDTYNMFVTDVSTARNLDPKKHTEYADAHIFTASQAKKVGLVDEVATISYAKEELYKLSGVTNPSWAQEDKIDKFMEKYLSEAVSQFSLNFFGGLKAY
ncbi:endopeptidase IV [Arcobacter sp. 31_11_sub10_T18]|nr:endopeptidase IV [Arcobacter sp. 31_11_sub10_T18]